MPRPNARRLLAGRGTFVDDLRLPRMVHAAFLRSPHAHARIRSIDISRAAAAPGVVRVVTGQEMAQRVTPWVGVLAHLKGLKSAPQYPLAVERATWQGEPVAVVVARSRAEAEDAAALIEVEWEPLPAVVDMETALDPATPVIHPNSATTSPSGGNMWRAIRIAAFADPENVVVEATFVTGRHTGVCLEAPVDPCRL